MSSNILASSLNLGYAGVHKYGTYKDDACEEFHEINSWNLVGGTSEMYATIIQGIGGINSRLCVCILLWDG
jgi:hypothetical protein